jgi:transcriptional regulator with XRE-family HTH domain
VPGVAARERRRDRAIRDSTGLALRVGRAIREARVGAGLSLRAAAGSVGLSHVTFWRIERGDLPKVSLRAISLACAAVGLAASLRAYPSGDPARDAGQLALVRRLRAHLPSGAPWETEVPIPIPGDLRAVDVRTTLEGKTVGFEAETNLTDAQAFDRKAQLKKRDLRLDRLILVVADTRSNRAFLTVHCEELRASFPLDTRAVLAALRAGRPPAHDGIVVI